jgi:hypothetical protein
MKNNKLQKLFLTLAVAAMGLVTFAQTNYGTIPAATYTDPQVVRYTASGVTYSVANTEGTKASYTFTITNGTIQSVTPASGTKTALTATFTDVPNGTPVSITVVWNNTNKTSSNDGTITVSKTVDFGGGSCGSAGTQVSNIKSWTMPLAKVTTPTFDVCSGVAPAPIAVSFEGNAGTSGYEYKWKVSKVSDGTGGEDHTASFTSSAAASTTVPVAAITNNSGAPIAYKFEITQMQDGFTDIVNGDITTASVTFNVNPVPTVGPISSVPVIIAK